MTPGAMVAASAEVTLTLGLRMERLVGDKLAWLTEPLLAGGGGAADDAAAAVDAQAHSAAPAPPATRSPGASGAATPRGSAGGGGAGGASGGGAGGAAATAAMTIDDFNVIKPISRGAFGRVYLAEKRSTGDRFALKVIRKADVLKKNLVQSVNNERSIMAMANNPFVVRFYYRLAAPRAVFPSWWPGEPGTGGEQLGRKGEEGGT